MRGERHLRSAELKDSVLELERQTILPHRQVIVREERGEELTLILRYEVRSVRLAHHPKVPLCFTAVVLGSKIKLRILATRAMTAAKRFFGVPDLGYYAIADGIREILQRCPRPTPSPNEPYSSCSCRAQKEMGKPLFLAIQTLGKGTLRHIAPHRN